MKSRLVLLLSSLLPLTMALPAAAHDACAMPGAACAPDHAAACACDHDKDGHAMAGHKMMPMGGQAKGACACGAQAPCGGKCGAQPMHAMGQMHAMPMHPMGCACGGHGMGGMMDHDRMGDHGPMGDRDDMHGRWGGRMAWMRTHPLHVSQELRYAPATTTLTGAWTVARPMNDWFSCGFQANYAWQVTPSMGQGHWFSDYMGLLPKLHKEAGPFGLDLGALVGIGAMARTFDAPGVGNDLLQLRAIWAVEPRLELSWRMGGHSLGLVGTYLWTPNMADLGGYSIGLTTTFAGPSWGK